MSFFRNKTPKRPLDELDALNAQLAQASVPVKEIYFLEIITELETIKSAPMSRSEALRSAQQWATKGTTLECKGEPVRFLPPHRIYEIKIQKVDKQNRDNNE